MSELTLSRIWSIFASALMLLATTSSLAATSPTSPSSPTRSSKTELSSSLAKAQRDAEQELEKISSEFLALGRKDSEAKWDQVFSESAKQETLASVTPGAQSH